MVRIIESLAQFFLGWSFVIRQSSPSRVTILVSLWFNIIYSVFSILVNYYFQDFFNLMVILYVVKAPG